MYNPYDTDNLDNSHSSDDNFGNTGNAGEYKQIRVEYKRNRVRGRKNESGAINAGGAIIIIIFVVLCLTIFGLLSFTTAFADKKLADRNLLNIKQYYEADSSASEKLAQIYNYIYGYYGNHSQNNRNNRNNSLSEAFAGDDVFDFEVYMAEPGDDEYAGNDTDTPELTIFYATPMNNIQSILSEINFYYDTGTDTLLYKITEWKVVLTSEFDSFQYDGQGMNLVDPFAWD